MSTTIDPEHQPPLATPHAVDTPGAMGAASLPGDGQFVSDASGPQESAAARGDDDSAAQDGATMSSSSGNERDDSAAPGAAAGTDDETPTGHDVVEEHSGSHAEPGAASKSDVDDDELVNDIPEPDLQPDKQDDES